MHAGELILELRDAAVPKPDFDALMAEHQQRVLRTAYRLLGRMEDAQDVCQEVFLRLLKHHETLDAPASSWLYRVTVNLCNDHYRRNHRLTAVEIEPTDPTPSAERVLQDSDRKRLLADGLRRLTERERTAIVLRDIEGLPTAEVAVILGVEEVTVRTQCAAARQKLARFVQNRPVRRHT